MTDEDDGLIVLRIALYFGPACFIILSALWFKLLRDGVISAGVFVALLVANVPITVAGVRLIAHSVSRTSVLLAKTLLAAGDIPPPRSYPEQDLLIARGQYAEAAEYFRDLVRVDPDDCDPRIRLAELLERHLADPAGAEQQYLEARRRSADPRRQYAASNALIDLYRKSGRRDRLKVELARLADRYRGTAHGDAAAQELKELKAEAGG
ncbi:MAG: hypothetical protein AUI99_01290 [Gemmatimonadetes bacterium 13_1_40CM_3_69_22]|nr:MAG: hypothetical protein AUI99_01290 [Gemmatimonadetes bacterium 13_1_40CM_3_69_22]OLD95224.1 MAG: hypothetical protein AUG79_05980 [Gemmatimonadetes bacterium 13_1_20CM_4_69_16]PYO14408.1 MAG: hypothetical protein DMD31_09435 [Gemmatimonadota bacterium]